MAIVNVTPDSFYASSRNHTLEECRNRVESVVAEGATIVDIGGYSSRPGAADVSLEEEWSRVRIGLEAVKSLDRGVVVSIDTFRSAIVERAFSEYGDFIANDISAGEQDEAMADVVARCDIPYIAMHMRGDSSTMQSLTEYEGGVVSDVKQYLLKRCEELQQRGIKRHNIVIDPGFGFAKTIEQNFELFRGLNSLRELGYPILVGVSRKSMIYKSLGITPEESLPGSLALAWEALRGGNAILRVHDVAQTVQVLRLANIYNKRL
ncbi:MAG: dihydropteroate synthase [Alistipes sp.]|nr:dihydropteroate synthase [Alistipes sp.]